jgi:tetratricopeptide (TPR) repeat protein
MQAHNQQDAAGAAGAALKDQGTPAQDALQRARELMAQNSYAQAEEALQGILRNEPANPEALAVMGNLLIAMGRFQDAVGVYQKLIQLNPADHVSYNLLTLNLIRLGQNGLALDTMRQAVKLDPSNLTYQVNLGQLHAVANNWQQAIDTLTPCLAQVNPAMRKDLEGVLRQCAERLGASPAAAPEQKRRSEPKPKMTAPPEESGSMPWLDKPWIELPSYQAGRISQKDLASLKGHKILIGPSEIAGLAGRLSRLMKQSGVDIVSLDYGYNRWAKFNCDISLNLPGRPPQEAQRVLKEFVERAINEYDLFHFIYGRSLIMDMSDLRLLAQLGKKLVMSYVGSDNVAQEVILYNQARFLGYDPPKPYCMTRQHAANHEIANRYVDVILGNNSIPRGRLVPGYAETEAWTPQSKQAVLEEINQDKSPDKLYVLFAPTSDFHKGTTMVLNLLEQCKAKGLPVELLLIKRLPQDEARKVYALADVVIDNVGSGTFGQLGVELMLWEVPVLVYQTEFYRHLRKGSPDMHITHENFIDTIARCARMKQTGELAELGRKSRQWVLDHLDVHKQGLPEYISIYASLLEGKPVPQFFNRTWYQLVDMMNRGVKSNFYKFMFQNKVFDQIGVKVESYDQTLYH